MTVGWSLRGERAWSHNGELTSDGSFTVCAFFDTTGGYIGHYTHNNKPAGFGADDFLLAILQELVRSTPHRTQMRDRTHQNIHTLQIPKSNEFPGPRSVFVLDNWPGHASKDFVDLCIDNKIVIEYNVPYAPHIMVHEKCGRTAKDQMRKRGREWTEQGLDSRQQVDLAFRSVDGSVARACAREIGYWNF